MLWSITRGTMALIEHLEKLRHFLKITQYSSINETASNTGLSQAGLSKSLILLERELNCKLFKRSREGLTLTREGAEVLLATKKILTEATDLENRLRSLKATAVPRVIRVGMYDSIVVYFGLELQKYLSAVYPKVKMILHSDSSASLKDKLSKSEIDIAIGVNFPVLPQPSIKYFQLFDDHYSYYVTPNLISLIEDLPVLVHSGATDGNGVPLGKILAKDLKSKTVHTITNFETLKTLTLQGLGVGVLPTQVALPLLSAKELINVQFDNQRQLFGKHHIGFLVRTQTMELFEDFVNDILRLGTRKIN